MTLLALLLLGLPQFASEEGAARVLGGSWDLNPGMAVQVARYDEAVPAPDLDGDGVDDVFRMPGYTSSGWQLEVEARSTASGALLWTRPLGAGGDKMLETDDLNGDGIGDLLVASPFHYPHSSVLALSGADGQQLWTQRGRYGSTRWSEFLADGVDMDGDGVRDLVVVDAGGAQHTARLELLSGVDGRRIGACALASGEIIGEVLRLPHDVDGDGSLDYAVEWRLLNGGYRVGVYSFATGGLLWSRNLERNETLQAWEADRDGDGVPELLTSFSPGGSSTDRPITSSRSGTSGLILYRKREQAPSSVHTWPQLVSCGDLDHDGREELLRCTGFPGSPSTVEVVSGADFQVLQRFHAEPGHAFYAPRARIRHPGNPDGAAMLTYVSSSYQLPDLQVAVAFDAALHADRNQLSVATGGTIHFEHQFPPSEAGRPCLLMASHAAGAHELIGSLPTPLARGPVLTASILQQLPGLSTPLQILDAASTGHSTLHLAPGAHPALAGRTLWFASITWQGTFGRRTSAALPITFN